VAAKKRLMEGMNKKPCEVFNLGTGKGHSVLEIINAFERATGEKVKYTLYPRRPGDIAEVYADTTLANAELGWKAETSLEQTLLSAWNWEKTLKQRR
jgi:UDP-glucose 4-epimerase